MKMLNKISQDIREMISNYDKGDSLIFKNKIITINKENFTPLTTNSGKTIAFIDGGQAEILTAGNFCLSFIRVAAQIFENNKKLETYKNEFYLFTRAEWRNNDLFYKSTIYPLTEKIISEEDLSISSMDNSIRSGQERASITKIINLARRFAELSLAKQISSDFIVLDGSLEATFNNEDKYLRELGTHVGAVAKSSCLFTTLGNSPVVLLHKIGPSGCWSYQVDQLTCFVKLHPQSKHVFRFEGNKDILPYLLGNSTDALFLGYPYGLLHVDRIARVSNEEKKSLMMQFMLKEENKEIIDYLKTSNAHDILDRIS